MGNLESLRHIIANLHIEPLMHGEIRTDYLQHSPFARVRLCPQGYIGIRREGAEAFSDLALALFQINPEYRRGCKLEELTTSLFGILLEKFSTRVAEPITPLDLTAIEQAISDWFKAHTYSYHFFIPCVLTPRKAPPFAIGPVSFLPSEDFITREQHQIQEDFEMLMGTMIRDMRTQRADWIAEVDVPSSHASRAEELGNVAVDIALTGIQLAAHPDGMLHHLARMTSRTTTAFKATPSRRSDGRFATSVTFTQPGLLLLEGNLQTILRNNAGLLRTLGAQIDTFLSGSGLIPILAQSLIDAAFWAHEAFAEPLDTIAVPKLETAIEVLLRAQSASGAKALLRQSIQAFYRLHEGDLINPYSQTTVKRFVDNLVTDRSRILHGTWSTLNDTLEASREGLQNFVIDLLKRYILALGEYTSTASPQDNHAAFLAYVERQQQTGAREQS